tara:strand:+ start:155 stop:319 length:165 start_codon:yes stop_codon:yes gene_type:complete
MGATGDVSNFDVINDLQEQNDYDAQYDYIPSTLSENNLFLNEFKFIKDPFNKVS